MHLGTLQSVEKNPLISHKQYQEHQIYIFNLGLFQSPVVIGTYSYMWLFYSRLNDEWSGVVTNMCFK